MARRGGPRIPRFAYICRSPARRPAGVSAPGRGTEHPPRRPTPKRRPYEGPETLWRVSADRTGRPPTGAGRPGVGGVGSPARGVESTPTTPTPEGTRDPGQKRDPMTSQRPYDGFRSLASQAALWEPPTERSGAGVAPVRGPETDPAIPSPKGTSYDGTDTLRRVGGGRT